jgi:hypothetical protein
VEVLVPLMVELMGCLSWVYLFNGTDGLS